MVEKLFQKGKNLAEKGINLAEKVGDKISEVKESVMEYIPEVDFDIIVNKLQYCGYKVPKVEIKLTIPPAVLLEIDLEKSIIDKLHKENIEKEISFKEDETETNKVLYKILQGLDYAAKMNNKVKISGKKLSRVVIEGSIIPSVKLIYLDDNLNKELYLRDQN